MVLSTALFPLLVVRLYRKIGGTGRLDPAIGEAGALGERARVWSLPGKWLLMGGAAALILVVGGGYAVIAALSTPRKLPR